MLVVCVLLLFVVCVMYLFVILFDCLVFYVLFVDIVMLLCDVLVVLEVVYLG